MPLLQNWFQGPLMWTRDEVPSVNATLPPSTLVIRCRYLL